MQQQQHQQQSSGYKVIWKKMNNHHHHRGVLQRPQLTRPAVSDFKPVSGRSTAAVMKLFHIYTVAQKVITCTIPRNVLYTTKTILCTIFSTNNFIYLFDVEIALILATPILIP